MPVVTFDAPILLPPWTSSEEMVSLWGAAVIDTDGSISCSWHNNESRPQPHAVSQVTAIVGQGGVPLLRLLSALFGGNVRLSKLAMGERRPQYTWGFYGATAVPFLRRIEPFLVLKAMQARSVIELEERRAQLQDRGRAGKIYTPEFQSYAEVVIDKMHGLNWVGTTPRELSDNKTNPRHGGRPKGMKNGQGRWTAMTPTP
jgi:hypothetical protein